MEKEKAKITITITEDGQTGYVNSEWDERITEREAIDMAIEILKAVDIPLELHKNNPTDIIFKMK